MFQATIAATCERVWRIPSKLSLLGIYCFIFYLASNGRGPVLSRLDLLLVSSCQITWSISTTSHSSAYPSFACHNSTQRELDAKVRLKVLRIN